MTSRITLAQGHEALKKLTDLLIQEGLLGTNVSNALERIEDALDVVRDRQEAARRAPRRFVEDRP